MMHNPPHPGEVLRELYFAPLGLTVTQAAEELGVSRKALSELLNGHAGISPEMAMRLARAFDTTPESWMNLQQQYDLWRVQQREDTQQALRAIRTPIGGRQAGRLVQAMTDTDKKESPERTKKSRKRKL